MKVKPFYIRTAGLTEKEVGEAIDKCVSAGAEAYEGVSAYHAGADFQAGLMTFDSWRFFGVDASNGTCFEDDGDLFGGEEITLDQLDEWLGLDKTETPEEKEAFDSMANNSELPNGSEWKNGDECIYTGQPDIKCKFVAIHPNNENCAIVWEGGGDCNLSCVAIDCLSKPETPQQREERERIEAAYDLFVTFKDANNVIGYPSLAEWQATQPTQSWLAIVDKTGYRKAK